jgi:hypothetical protein
MRIPSLLGSGYKDWVPVDIQDKGSVIERTPVHAPELKWNK